MLKHVHNICTPVFEVNQTLLAPQAQNILNVTLFHFHDVIPDSQPLTKQNQKKPQNSTDLFISNLNLLCMKNV